MGITMNKTADYVQNGRKPGKGIPLASMRNWTKMKRIQPRDMGTGRFKGKADENAIRFGRTKAERLLDAARAQKAHNHLSQLKFEDD